MSKFQVALNASTLFPYRLQLPDQIRIAAEAGYEGIEIWVRDIAAYIEQGGKLSELKQIVEDTGIELANAIAFWTWADLDRQERAYGLELAVRESEWLAELGCPCAAAPPYGQVEGIALDQIAESYYELVHRVRPLGVEPVLEFWGRAKALSRLDEAIYIAAKSGVSNAKLLIDPFHMYTGGSPIEDLSRISGHQIGIVHVNDYPSEPPRETIQDRDRLFPGEGIFRHGEFSSLLAGIGYSGFLSLELFIPDFGERTALEVAKYGLEAVRKSYSIG